jgi:hypothetical protein
MHSSRQVKKQNISNNLNVYYCVLKTSWWDMHHAANSKLSVEQEHFMLI